MNERELHRLYGAWAGRTPGDVAALLTDYGRPWWIAGGWALEAVLGRWRDHADVDACFLARDLDVLLAHVRGRGFDVWATPDGALVPLVGDRPLPAGTANLWLRRGAARPWEFDLLLNPDDGDRWVFKRDPSFTLPLTEALVEVDGVAYLRPALTLLLKAKGNRPKDATDCCEALARMDDGETALLRDVLARFYPDHPWRAWAR